MNPSNGLNQLNSPDVGPGTSRKPLVRVLTDRQFVIAAIILAAVALGWSATVRTLRWAMLKEAIAWPAGVEVSPDFRLTSLPPVLGKFVLAPDGVLQRDPRTRKPILDGQPDGEIILTEDVLKELGVGTPADKPRLATRSSNWYLSRFYIDRTSPPPLNAWVLQLTYYTGMLDRVPHIPERCMTAAGATLADKKVVTFDLGQKTPWGSQIKLVRVIFQKKDNAGRVDQHFQYYTFSLNGANEPLYEKVRWSLAATPWERYCYFSKIQFSPAFPVTGDVKAEQVDQAALEFVKGFLPEVLKALPMSAEVEASNAGRSVAAKERD